MNDVTRILLDIERGDPKAAEQLLPLVYDELRKLAAEKLANILLENGVERVKLTDFGLARAADDASLTQSGVVAGTPSYMSPGAGRGEAGRSPVGPVQPGQRAVRDVHRPAAVPGRHQHGRAQAGVRGDPDRRSARPTPRSPTGWSR